MKITIQSLINLIISLTIGLVMTYFFLKPVYEVFGIAFYGNLWILWFASAYLIYFFLKLVSLFKGENIITRERPVSYANWVVLFLSAGIILIPLIKGVIPY